MGCIPEFHTGYEKERRVMGCIPEFHAGYEKERRMMGCIDRVYTRVSYRL